MTMLNERAARLFEALAEEREMLRVEPSSTSSGTRLIDCGVAAPGGLEAGRRLAELCLSGLGRVELVPAPVDVWRGPAVQVATDHPVAACMASQYAGWQITGEKYFAMGSGPMRAAAAKEPLFERIGCRERPDRAVGVLEASRLPPDDVCQNIAAAAGVEPTRLLLAVARTASQAGTVQVVARSVETALHKLFELGFDLSKIESGYGLAPIPPVAADDLTALGRTNDAILYGGEVTLWVRAGEAELLDLGPQVPSASSRDFGAPFAEIFERAGRDFYKIDPHLFSPAVIRLVSLESGRAHAFGQFAPDVIERSFGG